jgi:hypothetical protein
MVKSRPRSQNTDPGEYVLLLVLIALIVGVVVFHVAHVGPP